MPAVEWRNDRSSSSISVSRTSTRRCGGGSRPRWGKAVKAPRHLPGRHGLDQLAPAQVHHPHNLYGAHFDDYPEEELDETEYTASALRSSLNRFVYEYDFGDSWTREVAVEDVSSRPRSSSSTGCASTGRGQIRKRGWHGGYQEFLAALAVHCTKSTTTTWSGWAQIRCRRHLDRLMHGAIVFNIKGPTWRMKERHALATPSRTSIDDEDDRHETNGRRRRWSLSKRGTGLSSPRIPLIAESETQ